MLVSTSDTTFAITCLHDKLGHTTSYKYLKKRRKEKSNEFI